MIDQQFSGTPTEKKHDLAWVIVNILVRGGVVMIPVYIILMVVVGIILVQTGTSAEALAKRILSDKAFADNVKMIYLLVSLIVFPISYFGIKWGCKYVSEKTRIDEKDFGKIGYWVGLAPIALSLLNRDLVAGAAIFGIFVTPRLVKKWLARFQGSTG